MIGLELQVTPLSVVAEDSLDARPLLRDENVLVCSGTCPARLTRGGGSETSFHAIRLLEQARRNMDY